MGSPMPGWGMPPMAMQNSGSGFDPRFAPGMDMGLQASPVQAMGSGDPSRDNSPAGRRSPAVRRPESGQNSPKPQ